MSKSKAVIALEARLELATVVYKNQRDEIRALKAQLAERDAQLDALGTRPVVQRAQPTPVVTQFTKADGSVWIKERTGNMARIYPAH